MKLKKIILLFLLTFVFFIGSIRVNAIFSNETYSYEWAKANIGGNYNCKSLKSPTELLQNLKNYNLREDVANANATSRELMRTIVCVNGNEISVADINYNDYENPLDTLAKLKEDYKNQISGVRESWLSEQVKFNKKHNDIENPEISQENTNTCFEKYSNFLNNINAAVVSPYNTAVKDHVDGNANTRTGAQANWQLMNSAREAVKVYQKEKTKTMSVICDELVPNLAKKINETLDFVNDILLESDNSYTEIDKRLDNNEQIFVEEEITSNQTENQKKFEDLVRKKYDNIGKNCNEIRQLWFKYDNGQLKEAPPFKVSGVEYSIRDFKAMYDECARMYQNIDDAQKADNGDKTAQDKLLNDLKENGDLTMEEIAELEAYTQDLNNIKHDIISGGGASCSEIMSGLTELLKNYYAILIGFAFVILTGFGIYDFIKATMSGEADATKKAFKTFSKRLIILIILLLLVFILKFLIEILNLAGYELDLCGIF